MMPDAVTRLLMQIFEVLLNVWQRGDHVKASAAIEGILAQGDPAGSQWWNENGIWQDAVRWPNSRMAPGSRSSTSSARSPTGPTTRDTRCRNRDQSFTRASDRQSSWETIRVVGEQRVYVQFRQVVTHFIAD